MNDATNAYMIVADVPRNPYKDLPQPVPLAEYEEFGHSAVVALQIPELLITYTMANKLKLNIFNTFTQKTVFELIYSSDFGVRFLNHMHADGVVGDTYLDVDLDL